MDMLKSNAGQIGTNMINKAIIGLVLLTVLFILYSTLVPTAQTAGDDLNSSGVPLGALFVSDGVVFVIIMAALVILVIKAFLPSGR